MSGAAIEPFMPLSLPRLNADLRPLKGRIRSTPEDFRVDEIPAYAASGNGDHLFVRIEKRDLTTREACKRIAWALREQGCDIDLRNVGTAGLKDRHAVTTQWLSLPGVNAEQVANLEVDGLRVLEAIPHEKKLRTGHLKGNRFSLRVREVSPDDLARLGEVQTALDVLHTKGMPNYFGEQRFGRDGDNAEVALAFLKGEAKRPRDRFRRKLLISALQSKLFNAVIAERLDGGGLAEVRLGELLKKEETGGLFCSTEPDVDQKRADQWELSPTGPMFGSKMRRPEADADAAERTLLEAHGLSDELLAKMGKDGQGTRRQVRVRPGTPTLEAHEDGFTVSFDLPSGSYATVLLREFLVCDEGPEHENHGG